MKPDYNANSSGGTAGRAIFTLMINEGNAKRSGQVTLPAP